MLLSTLKINIFLAGCFVIWFGIVFLFSYRKILQKLYFKVVEFAILTVLIRKLAELKQLNLKKWIFSISKLIVLQPKIFEYSNKQPIFLLISTFSLASTPLLISTSLLASISLLATKSSFLISLKLLLKKKMKKKQIGNIRTM